MKAPLFRSVRAGLILRARSVWRKRGLWLRAIVSLVIGAAFLLADRDFDYDIRLFARGEQTIDKRILLVRFERDTWLKILRVEAPGQSQKQVSFYSDAYYWNAAIWKNLLTSILNENPKAIGVTFYFGNNINVELNNENKSVLQNPKVIWSSKVDEEGRLLKSRFAKISSKQTGIGDFELDRDGFVRRFERQSKVTPHMAAQLVRMSGYGMEEDPNEIKLTQEHSIINYRAPGGTFPSISVQDVLAGNFPKGYLDNKIIILGALEGEGAVYLTPVGPISKAEITANLVDNILNDRWISRINIWGGILILIFFVTLAAWTTANYPQYLAIFILFWVNVIYATISLWIFDSFYFWIPVLAPAIATGVTYMMFISFQLTIKDYMNVQLEKERQFLIDVEQLKNNFLSLISHDLKTPIAKIQGICDRLIAEYPDSAFKGDIHALKDVASELHRYIRTIIQITRVESSEFRLNVDSSDINELTEAVAEQLQPLATAKNILLEMHLEPMFLVEVDAVLIQEVILNIVENAIKYTPNGGVVKISTREVDDQVFLVVEDTGPGIPQSEQDRIFEKFYRGEAGKSHAKGSGLGLYLVKYFVELHGGKIFLESMPSKGTRVGFSLPVIEAQADTEESAIIKGDRSESLA